MSIRRFPGVATVDAGVFWSPVCEQQGWRVQHNATLDAISPLKPYRLLDPKSNLWASADTGEELAEALPSLVAEIGQRSPLLSRDTVGAILAALSTALINVLAKRAAPSAPPGK